MPDFVNFFLAFFAEFCYNLVIVATAAINDKTKGKQHHDGRKPRIV